MLPTTAMFAIKQKVDSNENSSSPFIISPQFTLDWIEFRFPENLMWKWPEFSELQRVRKTNSSCTLTAPAGASERRHEEQHCAPLGPHICCLLFSSSSTSPHSIPLFLSCYMSWPPVFSPFLPMHMFVLTPLHFFLTACSSSLFLFFSFWLILAFCPNVVISCIHRVLSYTHRPSPLLFVNTSVIYCFLYTDPCFLIFQPATSLN